MKYYLSYNDIHKLVKVIAGRIAEDNYNPDLIVAIGTGGFIPARMLNTFLNRTILTVGIKYYDENNQPKEFPETIQWIDEVEKKLTGKRVLLVDEVDDSRTTLEYCLRELLKHNPEELAVMVLHNKKKEKKGSIPEEIKRYYAGEEIEDMWIAYPWDAEDIEEQDRLSKANKRREVSG